MNLLQEHIVEFVHAIRDETDLEKRLRGLQSLNESLPEPIKLKFPSLITNAYVRKALDIIEERVTTISLENKDGSGNITTATTTTTTTSLLQS